MFVNLYSVNADESESVEALNISLASCFPDDSDEIAVVEQEINERGWTFYGGGAAPLFKFVKVGEPHA